MLYHSFVRMIIFVTTIMGVVFYYHSHLKDAFLHNVYLNLLIVCMISFGIGWSFFNHYRLVKNKIFFQRLKKNEENPENLSYFLRPFYDFFQPQPTLPSHMVIPTVAERFQEMRDTNRYLIGLLIFLGLLGTFFGLSHTITTIAGVVSEASLFDQNIADAFQNLKDGLLSPLHGMGIAFSSTMFGLIGSLILGFLDFQNALAIQKFVAYLEDDIPIRPLMKTSGLAYISSLLEMNAHQISQILVSLRQTEEQRMQLVKTLEKLHQYVDGFSETFHQNQDIVKKIAKSHLDLQDLVKDIARLSQESLRNTNLENALSRIIHEMDQSRQLISHDIQLVAKTISALADQP